MKSPFAIFRKHQRVLTALLTGLAMFAFIFMDQMRDPGQFMLVLCVLAGAGLFWLFGRQSGKPVSYAATGAAIGLVLGMLLPVLRAPAAPVQTNLGDITEEKIRELIDRRRVANDFLQNAFQRVVPPPDNEFMVPFWQQELRSYLFSIRGRDIREDVVLGYLLGHEADEMGISVSDKAVSEYINRATNKQLDHETFRTILTEMGLSESILLDAIREELKAQLALQMQLPSLVYTPEEYWQEYRKLHVTAELDVVEVPVEAFLSQVPEPSEGELLSYFEGHRFVYPDAMGGGRPGFAQPRKFRIAYLQADYEQVEAEVADVTDEEIEEYYQDNIEFYRNQDFPDEADDQGDTEQQEDTDQLEGGQQQQGTEQQQDDVDPQNDDPTGSTAAEPPDPDTAPDEDQPAADGDDADATASLPSTDDAPRPPVVAPRPGPVGAASDSSTESTATEEDAAAPDNESPDSTEPAPEYRPLDDELRDEIRDQLLEQRTQQLMAEKIDAAAAFVDSLSVRLHAPEEEQIEKITPEEIDEQAAAYARQHGLTYGVTALLSPAEFSERADEHPVLTARQPIFNEFSRSEPPSVVEMLFQTQPEQLYRPLKADDGLGKRFAFWKVEDVEAHVPTFDEPGVREQAERAWKLQAARPHAEARAAQLAEIVRNSDQPTSEALSGQTVTGAEGASAATVTPTLPFSWLRVSTAPTTGLIPQSRQPTISSVVGVDEPGEAFMRTVFEQLDVGEVGVAPNRDNSAYYVVKVKQRTPSTSADLEAHRQAFMREGIFSGSMGMFGGYTPYEHLSIQQQQQFYGRWIEELQQKYDVRWAQQEGEPS